ncbi:MAG: S41 family peptidase [Dysgonamonadaceae bacterium]|nr:S41 family peptidase [Dysgonamonadaceae bacterium]
MKLRFSFLSISLLSLLFVGVVSTGCDNNDFKFDNNPQGNFDALWTILDKNYCFFEYKEINWDSIKASYRPRVTNKMSSDALFSLMGEMLSELQDGHVNLYAAHDLTRDWSWKANYLTNFDANIINKYLSDDYAIASSMRYKILEDNVGYIYYGSFSSNASDGGLNQILSRMAICSGIILDVRNNGGGSLSNVDKIASRFFNERKLVGYISHKIGAGHSDFSDLYPKYIESSNQIRHQKPLIILTNRGCYSATNEFVSTMKYADNVTIVGDKTGGGSGFPFSSELPNGWSVRFSTSPTFNAKKEHIEFGVDPDVRMDMDYADMVDMKDTYIEYARKRIKDSLR